MFGVVASPELQPLDRAIDDLQALDTGALHPHDIADLLVELRRETARLAAVEHALVEAVDRARPWAEANFLTTATWLATSDNTPLPTARRTVRTARRLGSMPVVRAALAAGDISAAHADRLATLNAPDVADAFAEAEEFLVGQARSMRWPDFVRATEYWLRHAREDADPDPDARDRAHRHIHLSSGLRGTGILTGELTPAARTIIGTELERREQALFDLDWADARARLGDAATLADMARTPAQRRHDALVEMAQRSATAPADSKRPQPLISVLVGYDRFKDICELMDGTVISPVTAGALLDHAVIERIVFDGPSRVLDLGRARSFTGAARRAVEVRDRHCTGPGCHTPGHRCHIDHITRHRDGGTTHPANGQAVCPPHNQAREKPPPPTTRHHARPRTPHQTDTWLQTRRAQIRDQLLHDPHWGTGGERPGPPFDADSG